jgi:hypothetical protein
MTRHEPDRLRAPPPSRSVALAPRRRRSLSIDSRQSASRSAVHTLHAATEIPIALPGPSPHPVQAASRQLRAHRHNRRENQIPIAVAAHPAPNSPRLRASTLFGRRLAECAESFVVAGVQKPAQLRTLALEQASRRYGHREGRLEVRPHTKVGPGQLRQPRPELSEGPRPPSVKAVGPGDHSDIAIVARRARRVLICVNRPASYRHFGFRLRAVRRASAI